MLKECASNKVCCGGERERVCVCAIYSLLFFYFFNL